LVFFSEAIAGMCGGLAVVITILVLVMIWRKKRYLLILIHLSYACVYLMIHSQMRSDFTMALRSTLKLNIFDTKGLKVIKSE